jgi:hypothetical protein
MRFVLIIFTLVLMPLHLAWASAVDCRNAHESVVTFSPTSVAFATGGMTQPPFGLSDLAATSAIDLTAMALMAAQFDDWEFFDDDTPHIVDQLSALDLRDVNVDRLACRMSTDTSSASAGPVDPHEFDLPIQGVIHTIVSSRVIAPARPSLPLPAPVFRTYRPPMATL